MKALAIGLALAARARARPGGRRRQRGLRRRRARAHRGERAPEGRPLRRRAARSPSCAGRSRSARGRPARPPRGGWRRGCAARCRTGATSRCPEACATSSAGCPGASPRSWSRRTTTRRRSRASSAPTTARAGPRRCSSSRACCGRTKRPAGAPELRFVLFDGEEATNDKADFYLSGLRGSQGLRAPPSRRAARARRCSTSSPTSTCGSRARQGSDPTLWARLRAAARSGSAPSAAFPDDALGEILDDHTPFAARRRAGDRPHRLRLPLLAQALRRHERGLARARSTSAARPCSSCCGPGASPRIPRRLHWP